MPSSRTRPAPQPLINVCNNGPVSTTFPRAKRANPGYEVAQVETFLQLARQTYDADVSGGVGLTSKDIRQASFVMNRGGYSCRHVDAALERLELAFSRRERERDISASGTESWVAQGQARIEVLLARFERKEKHRFARVSALTRGYAPADVDAFIDTVSATLTSGAVLDAETVRAALFRPRLGGYDETQVDLVLDALVDVLLAVATD